MMNRDRSWRQMILVPKDPCPSWNEKLKLLSEQGNRGQYPLGTRIQIPSNGHIWKVWDELAALVRTRID
jgi:hypothetical protein